MSIEEQWINVPTQIPPAHAIHSSRYARSPFLVTVVGDPLRVRPILRLNVSSLSPLFGRQRSTVRRARRMKCQGPCGLLSTSSEAARELANEVCFEASYRPDQLGKARAEQVYIYFTVLTGYPLVQKYCHDLDTSCPTSLGIRAGDLRDPGAQYSLSITLHLSPGIRYRHRQSPSSAPRRS